MQQIALFPQSPSHYGGELAIGKRKAFRPLAKKRPLHLVLKAKISLRPHGGLITKEAKRLAEKFSCRLYDLAVAPDHVHLVLRIPGRKEYKAFIRAFTGLLARKIQRGLFALIPFSRVASWGRDFAQLKRYLRMNREEASGERRYEPRRDYYKRYRARP